MSANCIAAEEFKNIARLFSDEKDVLLISYPGQIRTSASENEKPLVVLNKFYSEFLTGVFAGTHLLPFYPSTSDGGFAVSAYKQVDPDVGDWSDIRDFSGDLMFDAIFNHTSSQHPWFQGFLRGEEEFTNFYHSFDERPEMGSEKDHELSFVTRPRDTALLQEFDTSSGDKKFVWATFGPDQLDLNFQNPEVLLHCITVLIYYVTNGMTYVRIDAVPFLWKELGTNCMSHPKTHTLVKLFRSVLDWIAPQVQLITESNVPHEENISYFGDHKDEAQLVYNFSLAPLILYGITEGSTKYLKNWISGLDFTSRTTTYFNFTSTHDGIGMRPLEGVLTDEEIDAFVEKMESKKGLVSYRTLGHVKRPYELNITWASAMAEEDEDLHVQKILCSYALCFAFPGVPGVYFHNLVGTLNDYAGYERTQHRRDINRKEFDDLELRKLISEEGFHKTVFDSTLELLRLRKESPVFQPFSKFKLLDSPDGILGFTRTHDLLTGRFYFNLTSTPQSYNGVELKPYGFYWEI